MPIRVHEKNVRYVFERAEAFDILIAPRRLDTPELLQRGDYLLSSPGSNEDIGSLRAGACKSLCSPISPMSDSHHLDVSGMSLAGSLPDEPHSESSFLTDYKSAPWNVSQYPQTSGLRPTSRYSQAVEAYRALSPLPPLHAQRFSLPKSLYPNKPGQATGATLPALNLQSGGRLSVRKQPMMISITCTTDSVGALRHSLMT